MRITAAQHVTGVLTQGESPTGTGGPQTLLSTLDELRQDEIHLIESQAKYGPEQEGKVRWQFYGLASHRLVIARIIQNPKPDEVRRARHLAHSLVFSALDTKSIEQVLFSLLRQDLFFTSIDQVLACDGMKNGTGRIEAASVEAGTEWVDEAWALAQQWSGADLNRLVQLVCNRHAMTNKRQYVEIVGNERQILDALKVAFLLTPTSHRTHCSFDTNASGFEEQGTVGFWARGFSGSERHTPFFVDAAKRQVTIADTSSLRPSTYGRWLEEEVKAHGYARVRDNLAQGQTLASVVEGHGTSPRASQKKDADFEIGFVRANADLIKERVAHLLPEQFSPHLREAIVARLSKGPTETLAWLTRSQSLVLFCEPAYETLLHDANLTLSASDLEVLTPHAKGHHGLGLVLALKTGDESMRLQALADMGRDEYAQRVAEFKARPDFKPWQVFFPAHFDAWRHLCRELYTLDDLAHGISSVAEHGSDQARRDLTVIASSLPYKTERQALLQWLRSSSYRLPAFETALRMSLASEDQQGGEESGSLPKRILRGLTGIRKRD
jgi:hypothetical protein